MSAAQDIAIVVISRRGAAMAQTLADSLEVQPALYVASGFLENVSHQAVPFDLPVKPLISRLFGERRKLVLFMPVGAAVRLLAPNLGDKHTDPAVVCVDDAGRFAVSLVSGHQGGADALATEIAEILGATPVVTSASRVLNTLAVDMLGSEHGWQIEADSIDVTRASAAVVNGSPVGVLQEAGEKLHWDGASSHVREYDSIDALIQSPTVAILYITDRLIDATAFGKRPVVVYRPQTLVVGMGCRKDVPVDELEDLLCKIFDEHRISKTSIRNLATTDLKRDEAGLNTLAQRLGVPIRHYSPDDLNAHPGPSGPSAAYKHLGLIGVCEPAALVDSGCDHLLIPKAKSERATIAVARVEHN